MSKTAAKPNKPYPDFPLTAHNNGQWCKKIKGKVHFFGIWSDPDTALRNYCETRDDLQVGRQPRQPGELTVRELVNQFLTRAKERLERREITDKTFVDYHMVGRLIVEHLGKSPAISGLRPTDFATFRHALGLRYAVSGLTKIMTVIRMYFRWAYESELIDKPVRFGPDFKAPSKKTLRLHKASQGKKLFDASGIRLLLDTADQPLQTMILLAINGGLGNTDVGSLGWTSIDLKAGWVDFPRGKTGIERRFPVWPETAEALLEMPIVDGDQLISRTRSGNPYVWQRDGKSNDEVSKAFSRLLKKIGIARPGLSFYALRHTFQTIGDEAPNRDPLAVSAIMGHIDGSMAGQYRETISDERLRAVADHVRSWLFEKSTTED